jgi:hypothetical protein
MAKKEAKISFLVEVEIREALEKEAKELDRSVSWIIVNRLRRSLEADGRLPLKSDGKSSRT